MKVKNGNSFGVWTFFLIIRVSCYNCNNSKSSLCWFRQIIAQKPMQIRVCPSLPWHDKFYCRCNPSESITCKDAITNSVHYTFLASCCIQYRMKYTLKLDMQHQLPRDLIEKKATYTDIPYLVKI